MVKFTYDDLAVAYLVHTDGKGHDTWGSITGHIDTKDISYDLRAELWWRCMVIAEHHTDPYEALAKMFMSVNGRAPVDFPHHAPERELNVKPSSKGLTEFVVNGYELINAIMDDTLCYTCVSSGYKVWHKEGTRENHVEITTQEYIEADKAVKNNPQYGKFDLHELVTAGFLVAVHTKFGVFWNCNCAHCKGFREKYFFPNQASPDTSSGIHGGEEPQKEVDEMASVYRATIVVTPLPEIVAQGDGMPSKQQQPEDVVIFDGTIVGAGGDSQAYLFLGAENAKEILDARKVGSKIRFTCAAIIGG